MNHTGCRHKALFILCILCSCQGAQDANLLADMRLTDLSGQRVRLSCPASRLLVVNLWATWCAPCKKEMAHLAELREEFKVAGCDVASISLDSIRPEKLQAEVAARGITYPVYHGNAGRVLAVLGVSAVPAIVIINDKGVILKKLAGYHTKQEIRSAVLEIVKAKAPSALLRRSFVPTGVLLC